MPLIRNFRSTTIWKAFILNSIAAALVIVIGITVKDHVDTYTVDSQPDKIQRNTNVMSISLTILFTFLTSLLAYTIMYFVFGFGGGMLTD